VLLRAFLLSTLVLLAGCGATPETGKLPDQHWKNILVQVESRPPVPEGHTEFLVTLTDERNHPAWDCLVALRASPKDAWTQAIQDGRVAVYRRALWIDAQHSTLQVEIARGEERGYLEFSLPSKVSTTLAK
jgi:hypothetical protein